MKLIVQGVLQTRHTRVNIKTIRDFQGLQTMDPPGLPAQDISHATSINSLNTYVANIMVRKTEMFVHRPIPSFTDGTFVVVEPGPQPSHSLPHVLHIAFGTNDCVNLSNLCLSRNCVPVLQLVTVAPSTRWSLQIRHLP